MIVMTGANGRLGRLVAKMLAKRGAASQVTLTSRDPGKISELAALGCRTVRADFSDFESMRAAFTGATTALMISMPGPIEERIPRHRNAFDAAQAAKVGRLIYTSRVNPTYESLYPFAEIHAFSENYLKVIGLTTTIVRNNEYIENVVKRCSLRKGTPARHMSSTAPRRSADLISPDSLARPQGARRWLLPLPAKSSLSS